MGIGDVIGETGLFSGLQGTMTNGVILLIVLGIAFMIYKKQQEKKLYNVDVGLHKKVGDGTVYIPKIGRQFKDDKGVVRFVTYDKDVDMPAIDSRYFIMSSKGPGRRYIDIWNPLPDVFLPYEKENVQIFNRDYDLKDDKVCAFCEYVRQCKKEKVKPNFKSKHFKDYVEKKHERVPVCKNHLSQYYNIKFKVVSEVAKEWLFIRMRERVARALSKRAWWDKPAVVAGIMIAGGLGFVLLILKFGPQWFETAIKEIAVETAKAVGQGIRETALNVTQPPR